MNHDPYCDRAGTSPSEGSEIYACNCIVLKAAREDTRIETLYNAMRKAIRIIETHRISGYFCSCGSTVNAEWMHHTQMIQRALDEDPVNTHDSFCGWSSPCINADTTHHSESGEWVIGGAICQHCADECICELIVKVRADERAVKGDRP